MSEERSVSGYMIVSTDEFERGLQGMTEAFAHLGEAFDEARRAIEAVPPETWQAFAAAELELSERG